MSPEGKPIQVNASALQAASAQNSMGMLRLVTFNEIMNCRELSIGWKGLSFQYHFNWYSNIN